MYSHDMTEIAIPLQALKGRGVAHRQPHRFERDVRAAFDDGWGTLDAAAGDEAPAPATQVTWEDCKSAITRIASPDIGFSLGLNPYRGCEHVMWNSSPRVIQALYAYSRQKMRSYKKHAVSSKNVH